MSDKLSGAQRIAKLVVAVVAAIGTGLVVRHAGHAPYWGAYATGAIVYWVVARGEN